MQMLQGYKKQIAVGVVLFLFILMGSSLYGVARNRGYAPVQPIPFSHKIHAGDNKIPCLYCHVGAEKSKHATVPSMNMCMNCHIAVKTDSPYIKKLKQTYTERNESFEWVKVHDLPDFVRFNHKRHVLKGVACEVCHGDVKTMAVIRQDKPLTMGWCIDCHRGRTAPANILPASGEIPAEGIAPTDCNTCHY